MLKPWLAITICLAVFFPSVAVHEPAHAASCKVPGGQSGALKYSGQVGTISAKVCGNEIWKLLPKPSKPIKKKPAKKPAKKVNWKNEFTVSPKTPSIQKGAERVLQISEPLALASIATTHVKNRLLLWYPAQVRFHPSKYHWDFGDGLQSESTHVEHQWSRAGIYSVTLSVDFSVEYRILGKSSWLQLPGLISSRAIPVQVQVGQGSAIPRKVVLVHWNCKQRTQALGC